MADKQTRVFKRHNSDGTTNTVTMSWEKDKPLDTFTMDVDGYKGASCLAELGNVEKLIGISNVIEKPAMYEGEDPQNVFIVGMG